MVSTLKRPVGVLALQGSFSCQTTAFRRLGCTTREVRKPSDLEGLAALVLPGGESTVMSLLAQRYGLFEPLRDAGTQGLPMFGTCAGAILLGSGLEYPRRLELVDVELERNAYGRQVDSFSAEIDLEPFERPFHAIFIRAPKIRVGGAGDVEVLGSCREEPVLVRQGRFLLATFHPELTEDLRVHQYFLETCVREGGEAPRRRSVMGSRNEATP